MGFHSGEQSGPLSQKAFPELIPSASEKLITSTEGSTHRSPQTNYKRSADAIGLPRAAVISVQNAHLHGELYGDFLKARKRVFIDQKLWKLPQTDGMEFDQYDTPQSRAIVLHEYGEVVAGIRILPTQARCGCYSYMLRDAQLGIIDEIPQHILYERAPVANHVWEATRLFISPDVPSKRRLLVQSLLMNEMAKAAVNEGATHVIGIVPYVFKRWLVRLGMSALPVGPKIVFDGDNSQAAIMHVAPFGTNEAINAIPNRVC